MVEVKLSVKKVLPCLVFLCFSLASCTHDESPLLREIQRLEQAAFDGDSMRVDIRQSLMVKYADFARREGGHAFVPEGLFRRADLLVSAGKFDEAVLQLQDVHDGFPSFDKRPLCAFLVAFIYDEHLNDRELAIRSYERTIALHPESQEAIMAQQSLALLPPMN